MDALELTLLIPKKEIPKQDLKELILSQLAKQTRLDFIFLMFDEFVVNDILNLEEKANLNRLERFNLFRAIIDFKTVEFLSQVHSSYFEIIEDGCNLPSFLLMKAFQSDEVEIPKTIDLENPDLLTILIACIVVRRSDYKNPISFMQNYDTELINFEYSGEFEHYELTERFEENRVFH